MSLFLHVLHSIHIKSLSDGLEMYLGCIEMPATTMRIWPFHYVWNPKICTVVAMCPWHPWIISNELGCQLTYNVGLTHDCFYEIQIYIF